MAPRTHRSRRGIANVMVGIIAIVVVLVVAFAGIFLFMNPLASVSSSTTTPTIASSSASGTMVTKSTSSSTTFTSTQTTTSSSVLQSSSVPNSTNTTSSQTTFSNTTGTTSIQNHTSQLDVSLNGVFAYDSHDQLIFAGSDHAIVVLDALTNQILNTIKLGATPSGLAYDSVTGELYIASTYPFQNTTTGDLSAIKVNSTGYSFTYNQTGFSSNASQVVFKQSTNSIYLSSFGRIQGTWTENISIINAGTHSVAENVSVGSSSPGFEIGPMIYDTVNNLIYGVFRSVGMDGGGSAIYFALNTTNNQPVNLIPQSNFPANFPENLAFNSKNGDLYIAPSWDCAVLGVTCSAYPEGNISIVQGTSVTGQIKVSASPNATLGAIAYDSLNGLIYVANGTYYSSSSQIGQSRYMTYNVTAVSPDTSEVAQVVGFHGIVSAIYIDPGNENYVYVITNSTVHITPISIFGK